MYSNIIGTSLKKGISPQSEELVSLTISMVKLGTLSPLHSQPTQLFCYNPLCLITLNLLCIVDIPIKFGGFDEEPAAIFFLLRSLLLQTAEPLLSPTQIQEVFSHLEIVDPVERMKAFRTLIVSVPNSNIIRRLLVLLHRTMSGSSNPRQTLKILVRMFAECIIKFDNSKEQQKGMRRRKALFKQWLKHTPQLYPGELKVDAETSTCSVQLSLQDLLSSSPPAASSSSSSSPSCSSTSSSSSSSSSSTSLPSISSPLSSPRSSNSKGLSNETASVLVGLNSDFPTLSDRCLGTDGMLFLLNNALDDIYKSLSGFNQQSSALPQLVSSSSTPISPRLSRVQSVYEQSRVNSDAVIRNEFEQIQREIDEMNQQLQQMANERQTMNQRLQQELSSNSLLIEKLEPMYIHLPQILLEDSGQSHSFPRRGKEEIVCSKADDLA